MDLSLIRAARPFLPDLAARFSLPVWARRPLLLYGTYRTPIGTITLPLSHFQRELPSLAVAFEHGRQVELWHVHLGTVVVSRHRRAPNQPPIRSCRGDSSYPGAKGEGGKHTDEAAIPLADRLGPAAGGG